MAQKISEEDAYVICQTTYDAYLRIIDFLADHWLATSDVCSFEVVYHEFWFEIVLNERKIYCVFPFYSQSVSLMIKNAFNQFFRMAEIIQYYSEVSVESIEKESQILWI